MNPRAEELLAERAQRPLDDKEHWELQQLGVTDDESFDMAAAAVVVATTVIEPMPQALMDKILLAAPGTGIDWRRTLPGVAMPPPPDQARDTMVSVNLSDLQPEIDREIEKRELEKSTEPLVAQKPPTATKAMHVPAPDTLPPPMRGRAPAIAAPSLVNTPDIDMKGTTLPPERAPEPFVSQEPLEPHVRFASVLTPQPQAAVKTPVTPQPQQALVPRAPVIPPIAPTPPPDGRTPLPQDSQPFSIETPPMAVPISRDRQPVAPSILPQDDLAARRAAQRQLAETMPLRRPSRGVAPWLVAAACLLVAGGAVWWGMQQRPGETKPIAPIASSPAVDRAALVANATDLTKITWTITPDQNARAATGDVVWSAAQQKGYMRFVGLKPNDPAQFQYQLWIFDKTRDQAFPVDGGVFDVSSDGEVIVPISPKLHVNDLAMFAVTVEKPGGVVVSKRERIVVTAART